MRYSLRLSAPLLALAACGSDPVSPPPPPDGEPRQCGTAQYVAFDAANHTSQDLRLSAFAQMAEKMDQAAAEPFAPATASARFAEARGLYMTVAELQAKVQGRKEEHVPGEPAIGVELDQRITGALDAGATATTAVAAKVAQERVEKTLLHFFFLSVYHELRLGRADKWDEGYGYWGAAADNAEGTRRGLARVATSRDGNNGTNLAAEIFSGLVDGGCALAKALKAAQAEEVDYRTIPGLKAIVDGIDRKMQETLAYSAGHEALEILERQPQLTDPAVRGEVWVLLSELDAYFHAVEPIMNARGAASAARAGAIRRILNEAWADPSGAWMSTFPADAIRRDIEAEYSIEIKG